ncbi:peptidase family M13 [Ostertagia ostertagi]
MNQLQHQHYIRSGMKYDGDGIPKFDTPLNGTVSVRENIADNEGMKIAYRDKCSGEQERVREFASNFKQPEVTRVVNTKIPSAIAPYRNQRRKFMQTWCSKMSDFTLYAQANEEHSPAVYRVVTTMSNFPPFAEAFFCSQKSKMINEMQCSLW